MAVPSEIRKLIGDRDVKAHASLSCSFQGPIGETHFVVADGQLFVFERESLVGKFRSIELDPAHPPKMVPGTFNDELHVALADGSAHELQVSSFDRDSIKKLLEENAGPAPTPTPPADKPFEPSEKQATTPQAEVSVEQMSSLSDLEALFDTGEDFPKVEEDSDSSSPNDAVKDLQDATAKLQESKDGEDTGLIDLKALEFNLQQAENNAPATVEPIQQPDYASPPAIDEDEAREAAEAAKHAEKQRNKNIYFGNDPGCVGCLIQTLLFFGGILAMWYAHEIGMLNAGVVEPDQEYDENLVFVLTKILAVIAGIYLGGKSASLFGKLFQKLNWTGTIAFVKGRAIVMGPRGKWQMVLDPSTPFSFEGGAHSSIQSSTDDKGRPTKRSFIVFIRVVQEPTSFTLRTGVPRADHPKTICGIPLKPLQEEWKDERTIRLDSKTFHIVLKRLQSWQ